jgi:hypothetical protein
MEQSFWYMANLHREYDPPAGLRIYVASRTIWATGPVGPSRHRNIFAEVTYQE